MVAVSTVPCRSDQEVYRLTSGERESKRRVTSIAQHVHNSCMTPCLKRCKALGNLQSMNTSSSSSSMHLVVSGMITNTRSRTQCTPHALNLPKHLAAGLNIGQMHTWVVVMKWSLKSCEIAGGQCDQHFQCAWSGGELLLPERHGGGQSTAAAHQ